MLLISWCYILVQYSLFFEICMLCWFVVLFLHRPPLAWLAAHPVMWRQDIEKWIKWTLNDFDSFCHVLSKKSTPWRASLRRVKPKPASHCRKWRTVVTCCHCRVAILTTSRHLHPPLTRSLPLSGWSAVAPGSGRQGEGREGRWCRVSCAYKLQVVALCRIV